MANPRVHTRQEDIEGQGGTVVPVNETYFVPDEVILDPNSELAVQIPEGVGADHSRIGLELADALNSGHVEAKFGTAAAPAPTSSEAGDEQPEGYRAVGDDSGEEHTPDHERVETPPVHSKPEVQRDAEAKAADSKSEEKADKKADKK